ncbi:MAG: HEAT repeat domain-containing protein, partial [Methanobacteriota archaeon]
GRLGDPRAIQTLVESLNDGHAGVRQHSVMALGKLQSIRSVDALVERLDDLREDPLTRAYAAEALGSIRSIRVVPVLQRHVADDDAMIRDAAARALERITKGRQTRN